MKIQATLTEGTPVDIEPVFIPPKVGNFVCKLQILSNFFTTDITLQPTVSGATLREALQKCSFVMNIS